MDTALQSSDYMRGRHLPIYGLVKDDADMQQKYKDGHELPQIGVVTAIVWSPLFEKHIGLGVIDKRLKNSDTIVGVKTSSGHVLAAKISSLPFRKTNAVGGRAASRKER